MTDRAGKCIDMHVHIVGNGARGSGCWLRPRGLHRWFGRFMIRHVGLPVTGIDDPEFDNQYAQRLVQCIRESSLDAAVVLASDQVYDASGRLLEGRAAFYVPNDYVLRLARQFPECLPAVSIHPARIDALEELDRCVAAGAVMLKLLPNCNNVDCNDRRYTRFWERMAELGLPLLAHTGGEHTLPILRPELQDPHVLEWPLQCGVTCIAAHSAAKGGLVDRDYFDVLTGLMQRYQRLYADISAFNIPTRSKRFRACRQPPVVERMLHGSDFPVPVFGHWAWLRGLVDWPTFRQWERHPNVLERDYQLKRAMGFPEAVFTRVETLLRSTVAM